jgi:hypothetical protein
MTPPREQAALRQAALLSLAGNDGVLRTHLPEFAQRRRDWLAKDPVARALEKEGTGRPGLGPITWEPVAQGHADHLEGKVLLRCFFHGARGPHRMRAAVRFCVSSEGPPGTAHGGSVIAVFEHAALHACGVPVRGTIVPPPGGFEKPRLRRCSVTYKAQVPLDETLRLDMRVVGSPAVEPGGARVLQVEGELRSASIYGPGKLEYDTCEAEIEIPPAPRL